MRLAEKERKKRLILSKLFLSPQVTMLRTRCLKWVCMLNTTLLTKTCKLFTEWSRLTPEDIAVS